MKKLKAISIGFVLGIIMIQSTIFGLGALKKLWDIEQQFDRAQYSYELELKEIQDLKDYRKQLREENRGGE